MKGQRSDERSGGPVIRAAEETTLKSGPVHGRNGAVNCRSEEQLAGDREHLRDMVQRLTDELEIAGIPYERILREYEAAVYVPSIGLNQVMVAMVGIRQAGVVPMQLCHREPGGGQYVSVQTVAEAVRLIKGWYKRPDGKKVPKRGPAPA